MTESVSLTSTRSRHLRETGPKPVFRTTGQVGAVVAQLSITMAAHQRRRDRPASNGLGTRRHVQDVRWGRVEALELIPELSTLGAERQIRISAARFRESGIASDGGPVALVCDVRRSGERLVVISADHDGVRLSDLLDALETGTLDLTDAAILDLASALVRAVAWLHSRPGAPAHGALSPAHVVLGREGNIVLTDAVFAQLLQDLEWNRERCWRECSLALPPSASLPRFDQRADVAELGAVVLAVLLRRQLRVDEFPSGLPDLITSATSALGGAGSALRGWLLQALHLHPRATFGSAADAAPAFTAGLERLDRRVQNDTRAAS